MKVHICDICGKVITTWEKIIYTEYGTALFPDEFLDFIPYPTKRRVKIEACIPCHERFMKELKEKAGDRHEQHDAED